MKYLHVVILSAAILAVVAGPGNEVKAQRSSVVATLQIPRTGVSQRHIVTGRLTRTGYPILLIKADRPNARWWVQEHPTMQPDGRFQVSARFGNDKTLPGTRYKVVVLVLPITTDIGHWRPGAVLEQLPATVPRSAESTAIFQRMGTKVEIVDNVVTSPRQNAIVKQVHSITGNLKTGYAVVVVRSAESGSPWWVQPEVRYTLQAGTKLAPSARTFSGLIVVGNNRTPDGSRFRIAVLVVKRLSDLRNFKEGLRLTKLPNSIPRSEEITVALQFEKNLPTIQTISIVK